MNAHPETLSLALKFAAQAGRGGLRFVDRRDRAEFRSWAELKERADEVSGGLQALGTQRGERVALVYSTCPEFFAAFFGILGAGAAPVPLYPPVRLGRMAEYNVRTAEMLGAARVRTVLVEPRIGRILGEAVLRAGRGVKTLCLEDLPQSRAEPVHTTGADLALVQFSSGTTGEPKPAALSHRAVLWQGQTISTAILDAFPDVPASAHAGVSWLPLYHDMGLIGCVVPALLSAAELTLLPPEIFVLEPASWLRALSKYRGTVSAAPNFAYSLCTDKVQDEELDGVDLSAWRVALNGAEAVSAATLRAFAARFAKWGFAPEALTPVYGLSEAALAVTFSDLGRAFRSEVFGERELLSDERAVESNCGIELTSVGRPLPGIGVKILDDDGHEREDRQVGRVWVQSPSLMEGYLDRKDATLAILRDDWLDTGDLGFLRDSELFITGRAKDILVVRGRKHLPSEVERAVLGVPGVRKGCAAAVSWQPTGAPHEVLGLFVEHASDGSRGELASMARDCAASVQEATGLVCDLVLVLAPGTLPRTSSGKIRRREVLRRHLLDELTAPREVTALHLAGLLARSGVAGLLARVRG
jgi:acyl-CoA synthetase (AMP-forming)/AMP-acid ligase II